MNNGVSVLKLMTSAIFSYTVQRYMNFGKINWANWWNSISKIDIRKANNLEECVLFGFSGNDNLTQVLNYCIIYTQYYIYIQRLFDNNNLELYAYLALLKYNLNIEYQICNNNTADKFERFLFIHDNLWHSIIIS